MTPATQAKALRLLQQQQFERVGGNVTISTDVRIIAATNQDLPALVEQGKFRADLYYRLSGFTLHLPPLRDRREDIAVLTDHFVDLYNRELGKSVRSVAAPVRQALERHSWPGNIREFQSAIQYALVHTAGEVLTLDSLPKSCLQDAVDHGGPPESVDELTRFVEQLLAAGESDIYHKVSQAVDRIVLEEVLRHVNGHQQQAAELLGISRMTLRSKLRALGLTAERATGGHSAN
jgi:two-component system, NtrC family, response regulator